MFTFIIVLILVLMEDTLGVAAIDYHLLVLVS